MSEAATPMSDPRQPSRPRDAAVAIVRELQRAGHVAYLAGGCVRDELLGLEPNDYDVATDAKPEQVIALFRGARFVGEAFGVVLVPRLGHAVEVATFRAESHYEDGRRPSQVTFTDARHDALRRDFTVNGLFEDPLAPDPDSAVIDFVGGRDDLRTRTLRAIGNPSERFDEDYLRMLRAVRFSAALEFTIEPATAAAIKAHARYLTQISRERIGHEVRWMFTGAQPLLAAQLLQSLQLDAPTLSESHAEPALPTLELAVKVSTDYATLLGAWMLDRHLPAPEPATHAAEAAAMAMDRFSHDADRRVTTWRKALCLSNEERDELRASLHLLRRALDWRGLALSGRKRLLAEPCWPGAWALLRSLSHRAGFAELAKEMEPIVADLLRQGVAPPPLVTGDDLVKEGYKPGPEFGRLLQLVYDAQLEGVVHSRDEALAWAKNTRTTSGRQT